MNPFGTLRAIDDAEVELMRTWRNAPEVRSKMYTRHEISAAEHRAWWKKTRQRSDRRYFMYDDGGPLGIIGLTQIDRVNSSCFWAFYAAPGAPRGTGSRMEFLALERVFGAFGLHKLSCEVLAYNEPVVRLHHKFGFVTEGVFREHHLGPDGFVDVVRLGLLSSDWAALRDDMRTRLKQQKRISHRG